MAISIQKKRIAHAALRDLHNLSMVLYGKAGIDKFEDVPKLLAEAKAKLDAAAAALWHLLPVGAFIVIERTQKRKSSNI